MSISHGQAQATLHHAGLTNTLTLVQYERLTTYLSLRKQWNRTHNLSGPKAIQNPWIIDIADGVALSELLRTDLPLYDVGTGSGIPGIVVAILHPALSIVLVEPLAKRVAFLKRVIFELKLNNVTVLRTHWPINSAPKCQVVSRAVVSPSQWPTLASGDAQVSTIYRYLAMERPAFGCDDFNLAKSRDYRRNDFEALRLERWDRA